MIVYNETTQKTANRIKEAQAVKSRMQDISGGEGYEIRIYWVWKHGRSYDERNH